LLAAPVAAIAIVLGVAPSWAQNAYISTFGSNDVSVISTSINTVTATIPLGNQPLGVAVSPDGSKVYVTNELSSTVSVIATLTNTVVATISVGSYPFGVAVTPDGSKVYVANYNSNNVSVIDTSSNTVTATISVGSNALGVAVTPDGSKVYVANFYSNNVSVIATSSDTVVATIPIGGNPYGFGVFIQPSEPPAIFAGTPGNNTCHGQSVGELSSEFGNLKAAADALGFSSVRTLPEFYFGVLPIAAWGQHTNVRSP
jgi:YVTN family beta-propeller protein